MNASRAPESFERWLVYWGWRGVVCAVPNVAWAWIGGYGIPSAMTAMAVGVLAYIVLFAKVSAAGWYGEHLGGTRLGRRLRLATNLRVYAALISYPLFFFPPTWIVMALDFYPGLLAVELTRVVAHGGVAEESGRKMIESFGWTLFTTLLQGAFVAGEMLLIALVGCLFPDQKPNLLKLR